MVVVVVSLNSVLNSVIQTRNNTTLRNEIEINYFLYFRYIYINKHFLHLNVNQKFKFFFFECVLFVSFLLRIKSTFKIQFHLKNWLANIYTTIYKCVCVCELNLIFFVLNYTEALNCRLIY